MSAGWIGEWRLNTKGRSVVFGAKYLVQGHSTDSIKESHRDPIVCTRKNSELRVFACSFSQSVGETQYMARCVLEGGMQTPHPRLTLESKKPPTSPSDVR
jgi:hypothetical protein